MSASYVFLAFNNNNIIILIFIIIIIIIGIVEKGVAAMEPSYLHYSPLLPNPVLYIRDISTQLIRTLPRRYEFMVIIIKITYLLMEEGKKFIQQMKIFLHKFPARKCFSS